MPGTLDTLDDEADSPWLHDDELGELNTPDTFDTPDEADLIWLRENELGKPTTPDAPHITSDAFDDDIPF
jgi:hypothetical protein